MNGVPISGINLKKLTNEHKNSSKIQVVKSLIFRQNYLTLKGFAVQKKNFSKPDDTKTFPKTKIEMVKIGDTTFSRSTFEAGWKWSKHIKPSAGTKSCQDHHLICVVSGRLQAVMDGKIEIIAGPGDVVDIPAGHDAWVVGKKAFVGIDLGGT